VPGSSNSREGEWNLLARFFGTSERFWMNLQSRCDLEMPSRWSG